MSQAGPVGYTRDAVERLAGLAQVWSHLYFFHPDLRVPDPAWERELERAVALVESCADDASFAAAVDGFVRTALDDPWTWVDVPRARTGDAPSGTIEARRLPGGAAHLVLPAGAIARPDYPEALAQAIRDVGETTGLVLDLRWGTEPEPWPRLHRRPLFDDGACLAAAVLGFFAPVELAPVHRRERVHVGWSEEAGSAYGEEIVLRPCDPVVPVTTPPFFLAQRYPAVAFRHLPVHTGPLAVLVDDTSIGRLDDGLAALQLAGRAVVVRETAGRPTGAAPPVQVRGGVELHTRPHRHTGADGLPVGGPDLTVAAADRSTSVGRACELLGQARNARVTTPATRSATRRVARPDGDRTPDRPARVASGLKLWAVLREFFPLASLAAPRWDDLGDWLQRLAPAATEADHLVALLEISAGLGDSHAGTPGVEHRATGSVVGTHTPPLRLAWVENRAVVLETEGHHPDELPPPGSELTAVAGEPVEVVAARLRRRRSSSTPHAFAHWLYESGGLLAGPWNSALALTFRLPGEDRRFELARTVPMEHWLRNRRPVTTVHDGGFAYVNLTAVSTPEELDSILAAHTEAPGLLLDVRGYPGHFLQAECTGRLVAEPAPGPTFSIPARSARDRLGTRTSTYDIAPIGSAPRYTGPVVVLVDAGTVSSAENFCICVRNAGRGVLVGRPTAGTDGNITNVHLPGGVRFWFSGMRVSDRHGGCAQGTGHVPDVVVHRSLASVRAGEDEILEAALTRLRAGRGAREAAV